MNSRNRIPTRRQGACAAVLIAILAATGAQAVAVAVAAGAGEDIRDIRGPKVVHPAWLLSAVIGGAVGLLLIGYGAWRWHRRRRPDRILLPFELALLRLEGTRHLMTPAGAREFCIAASDIVRGYIEQRFNAVATQRTTEEFLQDLLRSPQALLASRRELLADFLERCDFVKFAGACIEAERMESLYQSARTFINETAVDDPVPAT